jgi:hypothetical protein
MDIEIMSVNLPASRDPAAYDDPYPYADMREKNVSSIFCCIFTSYLLLYMRPSKAPIQRRRRKTYEFYRMLFDIKEFSVAPEWHGAQLRLTNGAVQTVEQVGMRLYEFPPIEIVSCAVGREGEPEASREKETARRRRKTRTTTSKTFRS